MTQSTSSPETNSNQQLHRGGIRVELSASADQPQDHDPAAIPNPNFKQIRTLADLALTQLKLEQFPTVKTWREKLFDPQWIPEICDELPRLLTEFMRNPDNQRLSPQTRRARALQHIFSNKTPLVRDTDLLPGQTTTSFVGPVMYMDMSGYCIWPELDTIATRAQNPFKIRPEVAKRLNQEIFPYWLERRPVQEVARYSYYNTDDYATDGRDTVDGGQQAGSISIDPPLRKQAGETPKCQQLFERVAFYLADKATAVSHTTPDFKRVLKYGFNGLISQLQQDIDTHVADTPDKKEFLEGVIAVYDGARIYAEHLAKAAEQAGNNKLAT
ncbi:MAG: formate acetyltransferase, partial [Gammaproteobacteria bacterium]|nr:formate acetyltransferase [Gammaproteobacteria bacterium]